MSSDSMIVLQVSVTQQIDEMNNQSNNSFAFSDENDQQFYGLELTRFSEFYRPIHGYLSLAVCVFGIIANVLNIIVLTRKNMLSATNCILTAMAVSDVCVIASYIPFAIHNFIRTETEVEVFYAYGWALFTLFHAHFTVVCHTISIWLTVILAFWRYLAIRSPTSSKTWCSMSRAKYAILCAYLFVPISCLPLFLSFTISDFALEDKPNQTFFKVDFSSIAVQNNELLQKLNFWVFSVLLKLIPCVLLTILSLALIRVLVEANKRKQRLLSSNIALKNNSNLNTNSLVTTSNTSPKNSCEKTVGRNASQQTSDRTTKMLVAILIMFLVCEFPSGILALLSGIFGKVFFNNVYNKFGDLMDMLALINSAVNFVLYCLMSQQFRKTFTKLFCMKNEIEINRHSYHLAQSVNTNTCNTACV
ncbi:G-protein coupled receptor dmsr-1-like [Oppia nitens]|uniref:G-protein coupled receptor dmsr-1-like n=1 Tax=Oppia nitens TaxID=1686743 RepID=UPI0023DCB222|nr:G-protein coupled receptor dmsr-1-like [Oppia nitens]